MVAPKASGKKGKGKSKGPARALVGTISVSAQHARTLLKKQDVEGSEGGGLSTEDRLVLLNARPKDASSSSPAIAVGKDPNQMADLIPAPGSYRKNGIWKKTIEAVAFSNGEPSVERRDIQVVPAGLSNLGNTCYVNAALQVLFTCHPFRDAIYQVDQYIVDGDDSGLLKQLQKLFLQLQYGLNEVANPVDFVDCLKLEYGIQQDAQEFQKLLMQLLETRLGASNIPKVKTIMNDLFCGKSSYVTKCRKCGQESTFSQNVTDFYELELQVKGMNTLNASIGSMLRAEEMTGSNQYRCDVCADKEDADRVFCLRALPTCLRVSLQRFVFDTKSFSKRKCSDPISFPMELDLTGSVHPIDGQAPSESCQYSLTAIILHRGLSASAGHYVAIVKDQTTGTWWKYDDDTVSNMGVHPFKGVKWDPAGGGDPNDKVDAKPTAKKRGGKKKDTAKGAKVNEVKTAIDDAANTGSDGAIEILDTVEPVKQHRGRRGPQARQTAPSTTATATKRSAAPSKVSKKEAPLEKKQRVAKGGTTPVKAEAPTTSVAIVADGDVHNMDSDDEPITASLTSNPSTITPGSTASLVETFRKSMIHGKGTRQPAVPATAIGENTGVEVMDVDPPVGVQACVQPLSTEALSKLETPVKEEGTLPQDLSSKDAYMLMYTRRGCNFGRCVSYDSAVSELPEALQKVIADMHSGHDRRVTEQVESKKVKLNQIQEQRCRIQQIVNHMPVASEEEDCRFIDSTWLYAWANSTPEDDESPIDNAELMCPHGHLNPSAWSSAKRISVVSWMELHAMCKGGPELGLQDLCTRCCREQLQSIVDKEDTDDHRKMILEQVKLILDGLPPNAKAGIEEALAQATSGDSCLVSRSWMQNWKRKQCRITALTDVQSPTAAITCPHSLLLPDLARDRNRQSNRVAIPEHVFDFIERHWRPRTSAASSLTNKADAPSDEPSKQDKSSNSDSQAQPPQEPVDAAPNNDEDVEMVAHLPNGDAAMDEDDDSFVHVLDDDAQPDSNPRASESSSKNGAVDAKMCKFKLEAGSDDTERHECAQCHISVSSAAQSDEVLKGRMVHERAQLKDFLNGSHILFHPGEKYALVPSTWAKDWRRWVQSSPWRGQAGAAALAAAEGGAPASKTGRPCSLTEAIATISVSVDGELRLLQETPLTVQRRGKWSQADYSKITVAAWSDWLTLKSYHGDESTQDLAVHFELVPASKEHVPSKDIHVKSAATGEKPATPDAAPSGADNGDADAPSESDPKNPVPVPDDGDTTGATAMETQTIDPPHTPQAHAEPLTPGKTSIPPDSDAVMASPVATDSATCVDLADDTTTMVANQQSNQSPMNGHPHYDTDSEAEPSGKPAAEEMCGRLVSDLKVCYDSQIKLAAKDREQLLSYKEVGITCQVASQATAVQGSTCNSNKRARRGRVTVTVSDDTTLRRVKLVIQEGLDIHPMNMDCYVRGRLLELNDATLGALEVQRDDVIDVVKVEPPRTSENDCGSIEEWMKIVSMEGGGASCVPHAGAGVERGFVNTLLVGGPEVGNGSS